MVGLPTPLSTLYNHPIFIKRYFVIGFPKPLIVVRSYNISNSLIKAVFSERPLTFAVAIGCKIWEVTEKIFCGQAILKFEVTKGHTFRRVIESEQFGYYKRN